MTLEIYKTRMLNETDFTLIVSMSPVIAEAMFRNKVAMRGNKAGNTKKVKSMIQWLDDNSNGLIYVSSHNTPTKFNIDLYFEEESDMVAFKLRWL